MNYALEIEEYVSKKFSSYGVTKRQEVTRLLYEIAKRDNSDYTQILNSAEEELRKFSDLKSFLIQKRYPRVTQHIKSPRVNLPQLDINPDYQVKIKKAKIALKNIFIENEVKDSNLVKKLKKKYSRANFVPISTYKEHHASQSYDIGSYNHRMDSFYIVKERYDFFKHCPCSTKSVPCNYHIVNLGSGCAFECAYCFLQDYINAPGIILPANIEDFFTEFKNYRQDIRVGSGELTDSLIFDHITEFSPQIVEFFQDYPNSTFEFKTKSDNIDLLLNTRPAGNIIVSWSMNPQSIIDSTEHLTASLNERLKAAQKCAEAGYKIVFHFDPIIYFDNWDEEYRDLIQQIYKHVPKEAISFISLGTLRMSPRLKKIIENRFPETSILNEEFIVSHDGKLRYDYRTRMDMYQKMMNWIKKEHSSAYVYLCMEEKTMCGDCTLPPVKKI